MIFPKWRLPRLGIRIFLKIISDSLSPTSCFPRTIVQKGTCAGYFVQTTMLRLSKKVEYGLVALQHLARSSSSMRGTVSTVREISDEYSISYDLLAKIMQDLKRDGMIDSYQGVKGGYALMLAPQEISLSRVLTALEDENSITECTSAGFGGTCDREGTCTIKGPMHKLQERLEQTLNSMTIAQLL